ncbi:hypothetical protein DFJ69_5772 [Thermomonospora umbrina]|uniref:Uncharacterized protein n=1 Tax=Thermomonospora umbrina TaxID=111806 RepID=A0A3D9T1N9_9ACTN|nr:hypothetical protein DFJ69_5772 [Thermomonospora umbrina]
MAVGESSLPVPGAVGPGAARPADIAVAHGYTMHDIDGLVRYAVHRRVRVGRAGTR